MTQQTQEQDKLGPCPFCGSAVDLKPSRYGDYHSVICMVDDPCEVQLCTVIPSDDMRAGIAAWNRRAGQAASAQAVPQPLTDEQIEDMRGEANRGFDIEHEHYVKAIRDAERAHGIKGEQNAD